MEEADLDSNSQVPEDLELLQLVDLERRRPVVLDNQQLVGLSVKLPKVLAGQQVVLDNQQWVDSVELQVVSAANK